MRVGFYKDELKDFDSEDFEDINDVNAVAMLFADENHQVDEESDMEFEVFVEDDEGVLHKISMFTEWNPMFLVKKVEAV
jgi:hypothetical protein